ncbi:hypothetical protein MATR_04360 [Marivirga tractuosa]|uniref:Uncharacterized protein n=1 Tax=Marivirga tractuosa (strain ATCC 23168 / DSM 4126 / NBRC 15989 / NCIMB 1408 / VKM B-1430 / H-43) TaxID=643867 RepID=E4TTA0_MARTH|nr:hypothetical protein [Marivirga tractuosa]ADR21930.1 hypothetical protein Ftrac_1945 [Marivirga tractuosa DSM 4126]BDD13611.1 hypothetical protein MATR_04360 [Marivirga tractuosa]
MKLVLLITLLIPLHLKAQYDFEPDSINQFRASKLGQPNTDSIKFEFRLWNSGTHFSIFSQLTLNKTDKWNYRTGFENHDGEFVFFENNPEINVKKIWTTLDSLGIRNLPNQFDITASFEKNGYVHKLSIEQFEKMIGTDGSAITIELFNEGNFRTYSYINPLSLSESFKNSKDKWIAPEHHAIAEIVYVVNSRLKTFDDFNQYLVDQRDKRR